MAKKGNIPWNKGKRGLQIPWNKGLTKETDERVKNTSIALKGRKNCLGRVLSQETRDKISQSKKGNKYFLGKHHTLETRRKMSEVHKGCAGLKGKDNPFYGKHHTIETKEKISKVNKGKHYSPKTEFKKGIVPWIKGKKGYWHHTDEAKKKISEASRNRKYTKEQIRNRLKRRVPSSLERKFQKIITKYNLPYKYTGDGSFILERCNPDFINTDGQKIAIEVYATFYKQINGRNLNSWKKNRTQIFQKYGWNLIFFNEYEVNDNSVLTKLVGRS